MTDNQARINELTIGLFDGATKAYDDLERLKMLTINIRISVARMADNPDARALAQVADIFAESIENLEENTKVVREGAKEIGRLNKED